MDPNKAFRIKKKRTKIGHYPAAKVPDGVQFGTWECVECGHRKSVFGTLEDQIAWLNAKPYCQNCGRTTAGWECISDG